MKPDLKPLFVGCLLLAVCYPQQGFNAALAQSTETMAAGLTQLEAKIGIPSNQTLSLFDRLAGAETKVFGSVQAGSLVQRIERLKNATIGAQQFQQPSGNQQQPQQSQQPASPHYQQAPLQQYQPIPSQRYQQSYQQPAYQPAPPQQYQPPANPGWYPPPNQQGAASGNPALFGYPPTTAFPPVQNPLNAISVPPAQAAPFQPPPSPGVLPVGTVAPSQSPAPQNPGASTSPFGVSRSDEPKAPPTITSLSFTNIYPPRFVRIEPANNMQKTVSNYIPDVMKATKNRVFRFKAMPVPVYVSPGPERGFTESCIQGFEEWEERTDGIVRFVQVTDPRRARIHVVWKHLGGGGDGKDCMLGAHTITKWKAKGPGSVAMVPLGNLAVPIYIPKFGPKYTVPPQVIEVNLDLIAAKNEDVRLLVLRNVVTHELGHALGLLGHSSERSDLMYPVTDEYSRLSQRDINTLTNIYKLKPDIPL